MKILKNGFLIFSILTFAVSSAECPTLPDNFLPVPLIRQANTYSCGAAVLLSVLYYWQVYDEGEVSLYKLLKTTEKEGTHPKRIVQVAKQFGLTALFVENQKIEDLKIALERGDTVIIDLQAWPDEDEEGKPWVDVWEAGHYIVLVGIDNSNVYAMDPSTPSSYTFIPISELYDRWHDYENEIGKKWKNYQLAIYIHGKTPLQTIPAQLKRIE